MQVCAHMWFGFPILKTSFTTSPSQVHFLIRPRIATTMHIVDLGHTYVRPVLPQSHSRYSCHLYIDDVIHLWICRLLDDCLIVFWHFKLAAKSSAPASSNVQQIKNACIHNIPQLYHIQMIQKNKMDNDKIGHNHFYSFNVNFSWEICYTNQSFILQLIMVHSQCDYWFKFYLSPILHFFIQLCSLSLIYVLWVSWMMDQICKVFNPNASILVKTLFW